MLPHSAVKSFMYIAAVETCADTYYHNHKLSHLSFLSAKEKAEGLTEAEES